MMVSPGVYMENQKNKSYMELIRERDELIGFMQKFEKDEMAGDRSDSSWKWRPSPQTRYQVYFDYLAALCGLMHEKYNEEYVWGDRTLKQDAEEGTAPASVAGSSDTESAESDFNATLELLKQVSKE